MENHASDLAGASAALDEWNQVCGPRNDGDLDGGGRIGLVTLDVDDGRSGPRCVRPVIGQNLLLGLRAAALSHCDAWQGNLLSQCPGSRAGDLDLLLNPLSSTNISASRPPQVRSLAPSYGSLRPASHPPAAQRTAPLLLLLLLLRLLFDLRTVYTIAFILPSHCLLHTLFWPNSPLGTISEGPPQIDPPR